MVILSEAVVFIWRVFSFEGARFVCCKWNSLCEFRGRDGHATGSYESSAK